MNQNEVHGSWDKRSWKLVLDNTNGRKRKMDVFIIHPVNMMIIYLN